MAPMAKKADSEGLAKIADAQRYLSLSRTAIYHLMDNAELKFVKIGKARRIPWEALRQLASEGVNRD
jgi:excisionase family DNA binding protein